MSNTSARLWQVQITVLDGDGNTVSGPHAYDQTALQVELSTPELRVDGSINTHLPWTASVDLLTGIDGFGLSLDNRDTAASPSGASLLAQGNKVDLQVWGGAQYTRSWPPLYILRTPTPKQDDNEQPITLELGDLSQLSNTTTPEATDDTGKIGVSRSPAAVINSLALQAGLPTTADAITTGYNLSAPTPKQTTEGWPDFLGQIAACNGYALWLDSSEALRLTQINLDKTAPDISLTIGSDDVDWTPVNLDERPPAKLTGWGR